MIGPGFDTVIGTVAKRLGVKDGRIYFELEERSWNGWNWQVAALEELPVGQKVRAVGRRPTSDVILAESFEVVS